MQVWQRGAVVLDLYDVLDVVRAGGTGLVHRVRHRGWGVDLAVKAPRKALVGSPAAVRGFQTEAETWVGLGLHPHVVACVYVRTVDGVPRVFAEWVDGGNLADAVRSGRVREPTAVLDVAIQSAWGLAHAHAQGLVHQDVKPANVMLTLDGTVKVTDFGMARARAAAGEPADGADVFVSRGGLTPAYCSPEQAAGAARLTSATDVWSWALTVFEMFAGGPPVRDGSTADAAFAEFAHTHPLPGGVTELLARCFTRDPAERPQRLGPLAEELVALYEREAGPYPRRAPTAASLFADGLSNHALSMLDLNRPDSAEELWKRALRADPHHLQSRYNRGLYRWRSGRITDVDLVNELEAVRASHVDDWEAEYLLALVHRERGDLDNATRLLRDAAVRAPDAPEVAAALTAVELATVERAPAPWSYLRPRPAVEITEHAERAAAAMATARQLAEGGRVRDAAQQVRTARALPGHRRHAGLVAQWRLLGRHGRRTELLDAWQAGQIVPELRRSWALAFSGGSPTVVARNGNDAEAWVFDLETGLLLHTLSLHTGHVSAMALSEDGSLAVSGGEDGRVVAWVPQEGRVVRLFTSPPDLVYDVALSADRQVAVSGTGDGVVNAWNLETGRLLLRGKGHEGAVMSVAVSADHRFAVSSGEDEHVAVWDLRKGRLRHRIGGHGWVGVVRLSPDGRCVIIGHPTGELRIWRTGNGKPVLVLRGHSDAVTDAVMRTDGRFLLSGSYDRTVRLWDVEAGTCRHVLSGHSQTIRCVAAVPDFGVAASGGEDREVRLWDLASGACLRTFDGHVGEVTEVAFSDDDGLLLSASPSGHLRTWALDWEYDFPDRSGTTAPQVQTELRDEVAVAVPSRDEHRTGLVEALARYGDRHQQAATDTLELVAELAKIPTRTRVGHELYVNWQTRERNPRTGREYHVRDADGRVVGTEREPGTAEMLALLLRPEAELDRSEAFWASVFAARVQNDLALLAETAPRLHEDGDLEAAEHMWRLILDVRAHLWDAAYVDTQAALTGLARVLVDQHREAEAETLVRTVLEQHTRDFGPDHPSTLDAAVTVASVLTESAPRDAEKLLRDTIPRLERRYGVHDERALAAWTELADTLRRRGRRRKADAILRTVLSGYRLRFGEDHPKVHAVRARLEEERR